MRKEKEHAADKRTLVKPKIMKIVRIYYANMPFMPAFCAAFGDFALYCHFTHICCNL